jgi:hypothetical protein
MDAGIDALHILGSESPARAENQQLQFWFVCLRRTAGATVQRHGSSTLGFDSIPVGPPATTINQLNQFVAGRDLP